VSVAEDTNPTPLRTAALAYARRGWHVVPLHTTTRGICSCGRLDCSSPGKHPRTQNGLHSATTDPDDVEYFWDQWPDANIGIVAGPSHLAIVDLDSADAITRWKALGLGQPTLYAKTGKGMHLYYEDPTQAGKPSVGEGIDFRAGPSYVVAPPSVHANGNTYTWQNDGTPIATVSLEVLAHFAKQRVEDARANDGLTIKAGSRHRALVSLAGSTRRRGHTEEEILALLRATNETRVQPPMGDYELTQIARSAATWEPGSPELHDAIFLGTPPATQEEVAEEARSLVESWSEFHAHTPEDITWIVDGLIAESSLVFIAAPPKSGKTWVALGLAIYTALGQPFLDHPSEASPVLYIALEGHRAAIRTRVSIFARGAGVDPAGRGLDNLHIMYKPPGIDIADGAWAGKITSAAEQLGAKLVIVDVLRAAAPGMREDGKGAEDFAKIRANLAPLQTTGCSVVLLHHFVKRNESNKGRGIGELMSGSGALFGHADLVLGITATEDGAKRMRLEAIGRDVASFDPIGIELHGEGTGEYGGYSYHDAIQMIASTTIPEVGDVKAPASEIRAWLIEQPSRQATPKAIRDHFDISEGTLRERRPQLLAIGVEYQPGGVHTVYFAT
jgi:hypothetical protein